MTRDQIITSLASGGYITFRRQKLERDETAILFNPFVNKATEIPMDQLISLSEDLLLEIFAEGNNAHDWSFIYKLSPKGWEAL